MMNMCHVIELSIGWPFVCFFLAYEIQSFPLSGPSYMRDLDRSMKKSHTCLELENEGKVVPLFEKEFSTEQEINMGIFRLFSHRN